MAKALKITGNTQRVKRQKVEMETSKNYDKTQSMKSRKNLKENKIYNITNSRQ